ncbi:MAG: hypothetical protein Q8N22_03440 [bacterium]|nr:hypothetical protein [bacterium]
MSDAFSDIAQDQRRAEAINEYLRVLVAYLNKKLPVREVKKKAKIVSGGSSGYFSGPVDFISGLSETLRNLKNGDKETWAKLLFRFWESCYFFELYGLSPWNGKTLIRVDYGMHFVNVKSHPAGWIAEEVINKIISEKDWLTYDGDDYLIVLGEPREAFWVGNSTFFGCSDGRYGSLTKPRERKRWTGNGTMRQRAEFCGQKIRKR